MTVMRHPFAAIVLLSYVALAGCGGLSAPSLGLPGDAVVPPANARMGEVVNGTYTVASGDTLAIISARTNTPIRALIDNNNLQPPYLLKPGQQLQLAQRQNYVVQAGDTLSGIAHRFHVSQSALVDLNDLTPPYVIRVGQSLVLPSTIEAPQQSAAAQQPIQAAPSGSVTATPLDGTAAAPAAAPPAGGTAQPGAKPFTPAPASSPAVAMPGAPAPSVPASTAQVAAVEPDLTAAEEAAERAYEEARTQQQQQQQPASVPAAPVEAAPVQPAPVQPAPVESASAAPNVGPVSKSGFSWPVQGKVIAKFGATADGLRNDGINIAAPAGAPVMAAADGAVAYAGNQLRGFGNLILVRHENGLISAYAHNQSLLVEKGAKVRRGDVIARVGSTGSVESPQLHFEIRKGEQAVDPLKYLDGGV